jgi:hypothetical protein
VLYLLEKCDTLMSDWDFKMTETSCLTFQQLRSDVCSYLRINYKALCKFAGVNFLFIALLFFGLGGVGSLLFLLWGMGYYLFHFFFFRWYFKRKPYLITIKFFDTLLPALKVMFMLLLGFTLLAYLPYFPLLFGGTSETLKKGITWFIGGLMGESNAYNVIISIVMLALARVILYRPLLGWVAAVIRRRGDKKNIAKQTTRCYGLFFKILLSFYLISAILWLIDSVLHLQGLLFGVSIAPLTVLFDLFLAKTYEILFLD